VKPPRAVALRPTLGVGVLIGAGIFLASQASGSDPALGLVLGGGAGIALGLTLRPTAEQMVSARTEELEEESR
jgi:hypothetical protein